MAYQERLSGGDNAACRVISDPKFAPRSADDTIDFDAIGVLVFERRAARRYRAHGNRRTAVADLNGDVLLAIDRVGDRRGHDVAAGLDGFQDLAGVGRIHPELAAAATLKDEIAGRRENAAVVTADSRRGFMLPDGFPCDRIPGADQFADRFDRALGIDRAPVRQ